MKRIYVFLIAVGLLSLMLVGSIAIESAMDWTPPKSILGGWSARQKVTLRLNVDGIYHFKTAPDSVSLALNIRENGQVSGRLGAASFEGCSIQKNRNWFFKKLHLGTDFVITGRLRGHIFAGDTVVGKEVRLPFNMEDGSITGIMFQKGGMDDFPMVAVHLKKE